MGPVASAVAMPPRLSSSRRVLILLSRVRRRHHTVKAVYPAIFSGTSPALSVTSPPNHSDISLPSLLVFIGPTPSQEVPATLWLIKS